MKFCINLNFLEEDSTEQFLSVISSFDNDDYCCLDLYISPNSSLEQVVSRENILKLLKEHLETTMLDIDVTEEQIDLINRLISNHYDILSNCDLITIQPTEKTVDFIERNPFMKTVKLYLDGTYAINHEDLDDIDHYFGKYKNIYLHIDGNDREVTIEDYKKTVNAIDEIVNKIKKYNLSPLEQIMYAYDLVRDRVYTSESKEESKTMSRDITSVLLGDKIVCVGYANIFEKVLSNLGINSIMYSIKNLDETKNGHRRNIVHIKDEKYGVDGVYYFDTTWDSKKKDDDNSFLNSYRFFAKLKEDIEAYDHRFTDRTFAGYHEAMCWEFEEIVEEQGIKAVPRQMLRTINEISNFIDGKDLISPILFSNMPQLLIPEFVRNSFDLEKVMDKLCEYRRLFFDEELSIETFLQVLYNVRKVEYYEDPIKYPFSIETFKSAIINSNWLPEIDYADNFLSCIEGRKRNVRGVSEKKVSTFLEDYSSSHELEKNIERIKLAKTLRKVYEKK